MSFNYRFELPNFNDDYCECMDCPEGQQTKCYHAHRCLKEDHE